MSKSDTMFNERDRRFTAVQHMLSSDPSYDNRIIVSICKMQIWIATNNRDVPRVMKQSFWLRLWSSVWFQVRATSYHLTSSKSAWKPTPKCTWMRWWVWWSPGAIRWPLADPGCGSRTRRRPTCPKRHRLGFRSATILYPSLIGPPPPPTWICSTTSFGHTSRSSPTFSSHNNKASLIAAIRRVFAEIPPALGEKACSRWLRLKAATLNRYQLYCIIKLAELIFFNKSFKIKLLCCFP